MNIVQLRNKYRNEIKDFLLEKSRQFHQESGGVSLSSISVDFIESTNFSDITEYSLRQYIISDVDIRLALEDFDN